MAARLCDARQLMAPWMRGKRCSCAALLRGRRLLMAAKCTASKRVTPTTAAVRRRICAVLCRPRVGAHALQIAYRCDVQHTLYMSHNVQRARQVRGKSSDKLFMIVHKHVIRTIEASAGMAAARALSCSIARIYSLCVPSHRHLRCAFAVPTPGAHPHASRLGRLVGPACTGGLCRGNQPWWRDAQATPSRLCK